MEGITLLSRRRLVGFLLLLGIFFAWFGGVNGVDLQWQKPVPRSGGYEEVAEFISGREQLYWWYSPNIPQDEQRLAIWPARFPDTGDHTLITDVIYTDDTDDNNNGLPDTGPYTVLLNNILNRCQQLTIGGSWDQELRIASEGSLTVGFVGNNRICENTIAFGPGFREGRRGDNIIYLSARDSNENSLGAGAGNVQEYWVVAVSFEGNVFSDSTQTDHDDGTFTIAYRAPGVCGAAILFVGCGSLRIGIPGSPFQVNFFDCDPPPVANATISRNGVQLEILFEYGTDLGGFPGGGFDCRDLLEYETGMFGDPNEVYCYWRRPELLILVFGRRATVLPGDTFILLGNFIRGAPPLQTPTLNATLIPVLMHPDSDIPRIHICGPEIIPSCADTITLDVAASRGTGGREFIYDVNSVGMLDDEDSEGMGSDTEEPVDRDSDGIPDCADVDSEGTCDDPDWYWKSNPDYRKQYTTLTPIQWSLLAPKEGDSHIQTILANITDENYYDIEFTVSELEPGTQYVLLAQATNYLGQYSSALHSFVVERNESTPVVNIFAPTTVQMYRSSRLQLLCEALEMCDASILVPNRTRLNYFWTVTTDAYDGDSIGVIDVNEDGVAEYSVVDVFGEEIGGNTPFLEIEGYSMLFGFDYTYTCYVSIGEGAGGVTGEGSDSTNIELISAPLQPCSVDGPQRTIYSEYEFLMDGSCSLDPNGPNEEEPLEYQWCCEKQTFPFAGSPCDNTAFPLGGFCSDFSATIPARSFNSQARQFQVGEYLFTLNLRQGERTATYDVLIEVLAENIPTVHTEEIETYYVDATQPVLLKGYLEDQFLQAANNIGSQYWTVEPDYFEITQDNIFSQNQGVNSSIIYLAPNVMAQGVRYDFTYHFRENGDERESLAGITIFTKENPQGGFCFVDDMNVENSPTTNRMSRCVEYEGDLDVQYLDMFFLDPLIDQQPYPRLLSAPVMCARPLLIPPGTHTMFSKIINGVSSRTIAHQMELTERPEYNFDDISGVIDTLQLQSGLMGRYNNFLQVHFFLLNMINFRISYYEPDLADGFPNFVCLPLEDTDQIQLSILREKIHLSFTTLYIMTRDIYYFENLAYITDSCVSPCEIRRTQYIDVQVTVFLTDFDLLNDMQLFRQSDLTGTLFAKGMQDLLINVQNANTTWFAYSECTRVGGKVLEFLQALSLSYMIDGENSVDPTIILWDRVWWAVFKEPISDPEIAPRMDFSYRAVRYILSDQVIENLESTDGAQVFDVVLLTSDFQPEECRFPQEMVSVYSDFSVNVNLGVTPFTISRLSEPIQVTVPLLLEEGELASTPFPAYWDPDDEVYKTDGLELTDTDYSYPGFFYSGTMQFTTDHATSFASIQDVPTPTPYNPDDPKVELWWFIVFVMAFLLLIFIAVFVPLMWTEYREKKAAAYEFPAPPPIAGPGQDYDRFDPGGEFEGGEDEWGEGEGEFFDEDDEYYEEDEEYDEEEM